MKLVLLAFSLFATATAFAPLAQPQRAVSTLEAVNRRSALGDIAFVAAAAVAAPSIASADGAVSSATKTKAKVVYGSRIAALKSAVDSGDFVAVAQEKNAFILFNSGVYPTAKDKAAKSAAVEGTNAIFAAVKSKDAAALKSAYSAYIDANGVTDLPAVDSSTGQGYSSDYSYLAKTKAAAIYVR
mmetsp:Transcript_23887/g.40560  ORF Transcript_23887/g.40560 Transcript_23887/m.40560 type:complete len:185 (-) Transcript_23887:118-672(-)|eukprot:CAMPEP_0116542466 /NCGR_PEP_ID=MMETSP0397-20121206/1031_1 /TAXON_ID=216820 /ORGANISM="Cyclophora tenuis, Strain ECT3854" /LENGTH=184 /DNA_ID=CAMNT_0004066477 /DNA_START=50 /DNA_END=604 /DNA_ORIENTATION=-